MNREGYMGNLSPKNPIYMSLKCYNATFIIKSNNNWIIMEFDKAKTCKLRVRYRTCPRLSPLTQEKELLFPRLRSPCSSQEAPCNVISLSGTIMSWNKKVSGNLQLTSWDLQHIFRHFIHWNVLFVDCLILIMDCNFTFNVCFKD